MGFSLSDLEDIGKGFLTGGAVGGGTLSGGLGALESGDNPLSAMKTGLGVDALGLAIGSGVAASGIANAPGIVDAGTSGASGAAPVVGAETPATTSQALETNLINGGATAPSGVAGATPIPSAADTAAYGVPSGSSIDPATGSIITPGAGGAGALDPGVSGVQGVLDVVEHHPIASLIGANMAGGMLQGMANRSTQLEMLKRQEQAQEDLADLPRRQKQGNSSVGGKGVNINMRPGSKVLRRPDGTPVYRPGTGIISTGMNGVRG